MRFLDLLVSLSPVQHDATSSDKLDPGHFITVLKWHVDNHMSHLTIFHIITFALLFGLAKERDVFTRTPKALRVMILLAYAMVVGGTLINLYNDFTLHNSALSVAKAAYLQLGEMFKEIPWLPAVLLHGVIGVGTLCALGWLLLGHFRVEATNRSVAHTSNPANK